jgi:hypothetical protein
METTSGHSSRPSKKQYLVKKPWTLKAQIDELQSEKSENSLVQNTKEGIKEELGAEIEARMMRSAFSLDSPNTRIQTKNTEYQVKSLKTMLKNQTLDPEVVA